jgi:hypothetical protein
MRKLIEKINNKLSYMAIMVAEGTGLENPLGVSTFEELVGGITKWAVRIATPIAVIVIVYAGLKFIMARGKPEEIQKAKGILWWAIIGIGVVFVSTGLVSLVQDILSAK